MDLDWQICSRARLARDARFDGKFFIAVITTGIYCRPICRSRTSKESNVRYFATAAAAAEAGFRPCLRCRPECSPGTAAWSGTKSTVSRALRLIEESVVEDGGMESLAQSLGVGSRHLRRLFLRHLGATPSAVAQTRRLHFAKKLIDETALSMTQVAMASGFGSVRRFNAAIHGTYGRTPTEIRKHSRLPEPQREDQYSFRLSYRPPYDWKLLLKYLAARATPGVELVEGNTYCRSISFDQNYGSIQVTFCPESDQILLQVQFVDPRRLYTIVERVAAMFDLKADWAVIANTLSRDGVLRQLVERNPGLRVPGCWDGFELATRAIVGQQISVAGATTIAGRIAKKYGRGIAVGKELTHLFPSPEALADADLTSVGLTKTRAATIRAMARAVYDGEISFDRVSNPQRLLNALLAIRGIGNWTAQYVAMRALREPDAFPSEDIGLVRGMGLANAADLERRSESWRPWRAYAAMYIWSMAAQAPASTHAHRAVMDDSALQQPRDQYSSSVAE